MTEKEKVIKGLTNCLNGSLHDCETCPYQDDPYCTNTLMQQALILLLKTQEEGINGTEAEILA